MAIDVLEIKGHHSRKQETTIIFYRLSKNYKKYVVGFILTTNCSLIFTCLVYPALLPSPKLVLTFADAFAYPA